VLPRLTQLVHVNRNVAVKSAPNTATAKSAAGNAASAEKKVAARVLPTLL